MASGDGLNRKAEWERATGRRLTRDEWHRLEAAEDAELVREYVDEGDDDALDRIQNKYGHRLRVVAGRVFRDPRLGNRKELANEAFNDAMLKIANGLYDFDRRSTLLTWMFRITVNAAIDIWRRETKRVEREEAVRLELVAPEPPKKMTVAERKEAEAAEKEREWRDTVADLNRVANRLTKPHLEILVLREVERKSYAEIAAELAMPMGSVMSRLFHARKKMEAALQQWALESVLSSAAGVGAAPARPEVRVTAAGKRVISRPRK